MNLRCLLAVLSFVAGLLSVSANDVVLNVRDYGAIGDGTIHLVREWIESGRYRNLGRLQRDYPAVKDLEWSVDEAAFSRARDALPATGGTIYFPAGHYVAAKGSWSIMRDHVRLLGEGAEQTILSTAKTVENGLVLAPYRHGGWKQGAAQEYTFRPDSGARGSDHLVLNQATWASEFKPGELVFIRNGACRYDQDYGEFNEIVAVEPDGTLRFKHALARDYTLERFNWAGELAEDFPMPVVNRSALATLRRGEGFFLPGANNTVSVGENIFRVEGVDGTKVRLFNPGRANAKPGEIIRAGTKIGKSRSVLKLARTTRDFRCERLQVIGRRKALSVSNSYGSVFVDCRFVRDLTEGGFTGGLTIDGDGGRFARFERCSVAAMPAQVMQFARSFGGASFVDCHFRDANVVFTEFNFDCEVVRSTFEVNGTQAVQNVIVAGKSCGGIRLLDNRIVVANAAHVFDAVTDIHSQKHGGEGGVIIRGNVIEATSVPKIFSTGFAQPFVRENNTLNGAPLN